MCSVPDAIEAKVAKQRLAFLAYQNIVLNEDMVRSCYKIYLLAYWMYIAVNYWRILGMKVRKAISRTLKLKLTVSIAVLITMYYSQFLPSRPDFYDLCTRQ